MGKFTGAAAAAAVEVALQVPQRCPLLPFALNLVNLRTGWRPLDRVHACVLLRLQGRHPECGPCHAPAALQRRNPARWASAQQCHRAGLQQCAPLHSAPGLPTCHACLPACHACMKACHPRLAAACYCPHEGVHPCMPEPALAPHCEPPAPAYYCVWCSVSWQGLHHSWMPIRLCA